MPDEQIAMKIMDIHTPKQKIVEITNFYNASFENPHTVRKKERHYRNEDALPVNIVLTKNNKIIGLLESRLKLEHGKTIRLLATLLVDRDHRRHGLSRKMFAEFLKLAGCGYEVVVHFRDSNRRDLEKFYLRLGFSQLQQDGTYTNSGEKKWKMVLAPAQPCVL